jgi:NAD(P)-dependent dehydrogenase (short-subunit alcohol dehydrogenase family)
MSIKREAMNTAIVISASSDIGEALCRRWTARGVTVGGTYRNHSAAVTELAKIGARLVSCDLADKPSVSTACAELMRSCPDWDALVLCPGDLTPVGPFADGDFDEWERSLLVNFTAQLRVVRTLLPARHRGEGPQPLVLFFAGGGTNGATVNYSAYTVSKIALMKMCELLDAELPDTRFAIIGPGWVRTKIHEQTLRAGKRAGENYQRTVDRLQGSDFVPMEKVLDCCDWVLDAPREVVSGRNFSAAGDDWGSEALSSRLVHEPDLYKLRRAGNAVSRSTVP